MRDVTDAARQLTPAEHYAEAERLLAVAVLVMSTPNQRLLDDHAVETTPTFQRMEARDRCVREAQVHATLATVNPDVLWPKYVVTAQPADDTEDSTDALLEQIRTSVHAWACGAARPEEVLNAIDRMFNT